MDVYLGVSVKKMSIERGFCAATAACGGAHLRARVVNKNQIDRAGSPSLAWPGRRVQPAGRGAGGSAKQSITRAGSPGAMRPATALTVVALVALCPAAAQASAYGLSLDPSLTADAKYKFGNSTLLARHLLGVCVCVRACVRARAHDTARLCARALRAASCRPHMC